MTKLPVGVSFFIFKSSLTELENKNAKIKWKLWHIFILEGPTWPRVTCWHLFRGVSFFEPQILRQFHRCCWCWRLVLQLLCLARVVLNRSKVVIIDEVMTVVDEDTEQILHRVVRTAFSDRTVINLSVWINHTNSDGSPYFRGIRLRG